MVANRQLYTRVLFLRGASEIDLAAFTSRVEVNLGNVSAVGTGSSGGDGVVRQAVVTILQDENNRFSPLDATSPWNYDGMTFDPLLKPNREIKIWTAAMPYGTPPDPDDWELIFHGYLGDSIRTEGDIVEIECRDLAKRLQERIITTPRTYGAPIDDGGVRADIVMQQILDDEFGPGVINLYVPDIPPFACPPFTLEFVSVWDALQDIAKEFGWFVGYRYYAPNKEFRLTLMEPPRDKTAVNADWHFDWEDDIYVQDLDITDRDIRNRIVVVYRDLAGKRQQVMVQDAASISEYGLKPMQIDETDTQLIKDAAQALQLANFALADLSEQRATNSLTLPFIPRIDLFDGITVDDPRISSITEFYGVESVRHTLDFDGRTFQTEVVAAGRVVGAHQRWLQMQARKGSDSDPPDAVWPVRPNTVLTIAAYNTPDEGKRRADIQCQGYDDQRDINRALQAVGQNGTVVLLEGDFEISDSIVIPSFRTLIGQGNLTVIKLKDNFGDDLTDGIITNEDHVGGDTNIIVRDMVIDGNKANQDPFEWQNGLQFINVTNLEVSGCIFRYCTGIGLDLMQCSGAKVLNNRALECNNGGLSFFEGSNLIVSNCEAKSNRPDPLVGGTPGGIEFIGVISAAVTGNTSDDNLNGIVLISDCRDCTVTGNTVSNSEWQGILLALASSCSVIGNTVSGCLRAGISLQAADDNIINGNTLIANGTEDPPLTEWDQIGLLASHRNNIQNNTLRKGPGPTYPAYGIHIQPFCEDNFVTNNDLLDAADQILFFDEGTRTITSAGNRPGTGIQVVPTYYTDFSDYPLGETPYDWFGWHTQDYISQVYTVIEDGEPALFMGMNSGNLWRIWGPKDAPAARNIEIFAEFKITSIADGNTNPMGIWMRVSGWNEGRLGGIYVAADGTTFAIKRRNFTGFTTLNSQAALIAANTWYKVRFRAEGQDFYAKIWESADPEPGVWTLQASENSGDHMTGARIGLGNGVNAANVFYRQFGYAIGGNTAPGN